MKRKKTKQKNCRERLTTTSDISFEIVVHVNTIFDCLIL